MKASSRIFPLFLVIAAPVATSVAAQTLPSLPALEVTPSILGTNGQVTLSLPPGANLASPRQRVALFEGGRPARVTDAVRQFVLVNGRWQTTLQVEADPGHYEFRLISGDRAATIINADSTTDSLLVPGVDREPGWWLFDGVPWALAAQNAPQNAPAAPVSASSLPLFLPGLRRDLGRKAKSPVANWRSPLSEATPWRTISLPPLRDMLAANYDWNALRTDVTQRLQEAQTRGERGFAGFLLPAGADVKPIYGAANVMAQLRGVLDAAAPGAALIFEVNAAQSPAQAARDIDTVAALCDAVVLRVNNSAQSLWPIKVARRVAEDQPFYDLPIWVQMEGSPALPAWLDVQMAGATGTVLTTPIEGLPLLQRNAALWINSVTLEDTGLALPLEGAGTVADESPLVFYERFRSIGRIPLLARTALPEKNVGPEPLALRLGDRISASTVQRLEALARAGARIYLEGAPQLDEKGNAAPSLLNTLTGTTTAPLPAKRTSMTLSEPWIFGFGRGTRVSVEQTVAVALSQPSMAAQAKTEKGLFTPVGARAIAQLEDNSPAVIINTLGKGEVVWLPHRLLMNESASTSIPTAPAPGTATAPATVGTVAGWAPWQKYYAGVADYVAPRMVQLRPTGAENAAGIEAVRVAMRRSPKGALLVALFNTSARPVTVSATVTGALKVVLDLTTETQPPSSVRGGQTTFTAALPANGWKLFALATERKALDDERNAPRLKARLR